MKADLAGVTAAAAGAANSMPDDFRVSITNAPGAAAYPISSFTWLLIPSANPGCCEESGHQGFSEVDACRRVRTTTKLCLTRSFPKPSSPRKKKPLQWFSKLFSWVKNGLLRHNHATTQPRRNRGCVRFCSACATATRSPTSSRSSSLPRILLITSLLVYELWINSSLSRVEFGLMFFFTRVWDPVAGDFGALPFIYGTLSQLWSRWPSPFPWVLPRPFSWRNWHRGN